MESTMDKEQDPDSPAPVTRVSYAQNMEDILLDRLFKDQKGTFMDVGANHPILDNNTYFFYLRGWQGINLEPIRRLHDLFLEHRPEDTTLAVAASDTEGTLPFYEVKNYDGLSTLSPAIAKSYRQRGFKVIEHQLPVRTIASLVKEYRISPPDLLCIDVEGYEDQVIRGIPLVTWRPKVLVVESTLPESNIASHQSWEPILLENGYLFATFNGINRFYLREDLRDKLNCFAYPVNVLDYYKKYETVALEKSVFEVQNQVAQVEIAWAADRARFEEIRAGWEWGREQADQIQHAWEQERAAYERERAAWNQEQIRVDMDREAVQRELADLRCHAENLTKAIEARQAEIDGLQEQIQNLVGEKEVRDREFAELGRQVEVLTKETKARQAECAELQNQARELAEEKAARQEEMAELRQTLQTQINHLAARQEEMAELRQTLQTQINHLTGKVRLMSGRESELREMLLDAHEQLVQRNEELQVALQQLSQTSAANCPIIKGAIASKNGSASDQAPGYRQLLERVREVVDRALPPQATVLVVSKGDDELLQLGGRKAWHFPQTKHGVYAGHHPADSDAAIKHLEELRQEGADFLLFPATTTWWLEHYTGFREYLETCGGEVARQDDACVIFALHEGALAKTKHGQYQQLLERIRGVADSALPPQATVLVVSKGDDELLQLGGRKAWHFPPPESGHHPADSDAILAQLTELQAKGADFLLLPWSSLWWLKHYGGFREYLETCGGEVARQDDACVIFALHKDDGTNGYARRSTSRVNRKTEHAFGVNVVGHITSEKGIGEAVRGFIRSMQAVNIPCVLTNFVDPSSANQDTSFTSFSDDNPYGINFLNFNFDMMSVFVQNKGKAYLQDRYNLTHWVWELSEFPKEWHASFQYVDEVWVPSNFVLDAVSRASPLPVVRIPYAITDNILIRLWDRSHFGLPEDKFIFLFLFDFLSFPERKNLFGLINAFKKAFRPQDDTLLVLKCAHSSPKLLEEVGLSPTVPHEMQEACKGANIKVIDSVLSREEVNTLLHLCDCYVSLHRSEGFGLTMAEAMVMEKPVIATGYSSNLDFMTSANSFLVKHNLIELERDFGPYPKGAVWADPDLDHAAELMRFVYNNRTIARLVGQKGRQDILRDFHPRVVGEMIKERLLKLAEFGEIAAPLEALNSTVAQPEYAAGPR
jgi:FkbM family methyltransferase